MSGISGCCCAFLCCAGTHLRSKDATLRAPGRTGHENDRPRARCLTTALDPFDPHLGEVRVRDKQVNVKQQHWHGAGPFTNPSKANLKGYEEV